MKTRNKNKLLGLALVGTYSLFNASGAFAAAGLSIGNTATLDYNVSGAGQTAIPASTNFVEDRLINYTVTRIGSAATPVGPDAVDQAVGFTLLNSGNSTQDFLLRAEDSTAADPFPPNGRIHFRRLTFAPMSMTATELLMRLTSLPTLELLSI